MKRPGAIRIKVLLIQYLVQAQAGFDQRSKNLRVPFSLPEFTGIKQNGHPNAKQNPTISIRLHVFNYTLKDKEFYSDSLCHRTGVPESSIENPPQQATDSP